MRWRVAGGVISPSLMQNPPTQGRSGLYMKVRLMCIMLNYVFIGLEPLALIHCTNFQFVTVPNHGHSYPSNLRNPQPTMLPASRDCF